MNLQESSRKSEILHFDLFLLSKSYAISVKKVRRVISHEEKLTLGAKSDMVNFNLSSGKSKNLHFNVLL